jgi:MFS family permease
MLLLAVGSFAVFDAASLSLFPVYGVRNGLDVTTAANILSAMILGNVVLQFPIGWLCDRFQPRFVMAGCALITAITLLLLPYLLNSILMWPLLILMGTTGYGVYTVSLVALGNRFSGIELINGSASFALVWGFGALLGSISGGMAMLASGLYGLPFSLALVYLILALGVGWRQISLGRLQVKS